MHPKIFVRSPINCCVQYCTIIYQDLKRGIKLGDSSKTILTCDKEKNYPFWAEKPAYAPYQPPAAIPSRNPPNPATSSMSKPSSTLKSSSRSTELHN